jgi:hypothetical protein
MRPFAKALDAVVHHSVPCSLPPPHSSPIPSRALLYLVRAVVLVRPYKRIENIDLTNIVGSHMEYPDKLEEILATIGIGRDAGMSPD